MLEIVLAGVAVLAADQMAKAAITRHVPAGEGRNFARYLRIRPMRHTGGPLRFLGRVGSVLMWLALLAAVLLLAREGHLFQSTAARLGLGAALGGAAGNLCDRVRLGGIVDFLDLGWWPVFNLADVGITLGAILALWFALRR